MIGQNRSKVWIACTLVLAALIPSDIAGVTAEVSLGDDDWMTKNHTPGYCAMRGLCGNRRDEDVLNCPDNQQATAPDSALAAKLEGVCPDLWTASGKEQGKYCCTEEQVDHIATSTARATPFIGGCPACHHNFVHLWCVLTCSGDQATFTNVTSVEPAFSTNATSVAEVDYWVTDSFSSSLYDSCKDVKFGPFHTLAMRVVGGNAKSAQQWLDFLGLVKDRRTPPYGSPFQQNFLPGDSAPEGLQPLSAPGLMVGCGDVGPLTCSCQDCPSAPGCGGAGVEADPHLAEA